MFWNKKYKVYYSFTSGKFLTVGFMDTVEVFSCFTKSGALKICDKLNEIKSKYFNNMISDNEVDTEHWKMYAVLGEYPNIFIDTKYYVAQDDYNYCLRDVKAKSIDVYKKDRVFCTYEEANNKVISLLQKK